MISLRIYFESGLSSTTDEEFSEVPASEVLMPFVMMTILGVIHTQIVGTKIVNKKQSPFHSSKFAQNTQQIHKKKRKRKPKQNIDKKNETSVVQEVTKTVASDEESGLGSLDIKSDLPPNKPLSERRGFSSIERLNFAKNIPRIEIDEKVSAENSDLSSDEFDVETELDGSHVWRRYSDSNSFKPKEDIGNDVEVITRRYSEGSKGSKNKKFKENLRLKSKKRKRLANHLSPPSSLRSARDCSSCDSEGTMSPTTPLTPTPVCFQSINSLMHY